MCCNNKKNNCGEKNCFKQCCQLSACSVKECKKQNKECVKSCLCSYKQQKQELLCNHKECLKNACTKYDKHQCKNALKVALVKLKAETKLCLNVCEKNNNDCMKESKIQEEICVRKCIPYYLWQMECCNSKCNKC